MVDKEKAVALIGYAGTGNVGELLKRGVLASAGIALVAPYTGGIALRDSVMQRPSGVGRP